MKEHPVSRDDLFDIQEMSEKIEEYIDKTLEGNQKSLSLSALISACINCLGHQCDDMEELLFYKNLFITCLRDYCKRRTEDNIQS